MPSDILINDISNQMVIVDKNMSHVSAPDQQCTESSIPSAVDLSNHIGPFLINSPNYPNDNYRNRHNCFWHFRASPGQVIRAEILDFSVRAYL